MCPPEALAWQRLRWSGGAIPSPPQEGKEASLAQGWKAQRQISVSWRGEGSAEGQGALLVWQGPGVLRRLHRALDDPSC